MYKKAVLAVTVLAIIFISTPRKNLSSGSESRVSAASNTAIQAAPAVKPSPKLPSKLGEVPLPQTSAKAILALDLETNEKLLEQHADEKLPTASLTKLMTAMVVSDTVSETDVVTIQKPDVQVECSCMGLVAGEQITVENLLKGLLIPSGNDAAQALARFAGGDSVQNFVYLMNQKAETLGLSSTHFSNPVGLDSPGNYSTANDLAKITESFLKYPELEKIVATAGVNVSSVDGKIVHKLRTSNKLLLTDSDVVGVKTGYTDEAQGNLIVKIERDKAQVLTVVLNTPDREGDTQKVIDWIFAEYSW
ncbi:MAG TPA: D-alanyl-D-alanine carboxypeptidase family protein [Patescibacteria group bacterium]|nr:D-alanyl-D-alanine carboxypeptidase family protein [Patescibacteria group bacterium]